jgi:hypothetical protein
MTARPTTTSTVADLRDGDVFSLDNGATWHVCAVVLFGNVAVYADARRGPDAPTVRVDGEPDAEVTRPMMTARQDALVCTVPTHDHTTPVDREGMSVDPPIPMMCVDCGVSTHYDSTVEDYQHDDPDAPPCFLVPYAIPEAQPCAVSA